MTQRSALKHDLFAAEPHRQKLDRLGAPLAEIEAYVDCAARAPEGDRLAPRLVSAPGGRSPFPTETMGRLLVRQRWYHLSDEQLEYQLLDRMSYQRVCGLPPALNIPDRTTIWTGENRSGDAGARALFAGLSAQLLKPGDVARGGQLIDATLVPAPQQPLGRDERAMLEPQAVPADWKPAPRRQKDLDATWTKKHSKSHFGYKLSLTVATRCKVIRKIKIDTASTHDSPPFDPVFDTAPPSREGYADRGYPRAARAAQLQEAGYRNHLQRKGTRPRALSACQQQRHRRIAKTRARGEHGFAAREPMGGRLIRTIGQARARVAMTMRPACYNLTRLGYLGRAGIEAC